MEKFDVIVVGAGPGGYPAAIRAAQLGAKTALIEREVLGGTCLNWGCIPTKLLLAGAEFYHEVRHADRLGLQTEGARPDYAKLWQRKNEVVEQLRNGIRTLLKSNGVTAIKGTASFLTPRRLAVQREREPLVLEAERIILATGSRSIRPRLFPASSRILESRAFLDQDRMPAALLIVGGGIIGCEFACLAARLGVTVTLVEMLPDILAILDADVRREVRRTMERQLGIRLRCGAPIEEVREERDRVRCRIGDEWLDAEQVLVAVGRTPVTEGLGLDRIGLSLLPSGHIETDCYLRTRHASIFAIGDLIPGPQLAHRATAEGLTAAWNATQRHPESRPTLIPSAIFTAPEVGTVGLTEEEAKQRGQAIRVGKFPFAALGKALAIGRADGFVKWIADAGTGQLLGAQAVGPAASDLIAEAAVAIQGEWTAAEFGRVVHAHPTLAEAWMEAAHVLEGRPVHIPGEKKTR